MGENKQHIKLQLEDSKSEHLQFLAFSAPEHYFGLIGQKIKIWCTLGINEWRGNRSVEGKLLEVELV